jgi:hypothetical protein
VQRWAEFCILYEPAIVGFGLSISGDSCEAEGAEIVEAIDRRRNVED